jgi:putative phosphonate metabolism protein
MRYAIYFTSPEDSLLTRQAAQWLGRDAFRDLTVSQHPTEEFDQEEIAALTEAPRRYGFHATLKAPFGLAPDRSESQLISAFDDFAATVVAFDIPSVSLGQIGPFFALVPSARSEELHALADACVRHFEPFRAPLSQADISRRSPGNLTPDQRRNLEDWGYPYVFEEFRFHMTLTGPVPTDRQPAMRSILERTFAGFIGGPLSISHLALFIEAERGSPFVVKRIMPLRSLPQRKTA